MLLNSDLDLKSKDISRLKRSSVMFGNQTQQMNYSIQQSKQRSEQAKIPSDRLSAPKTEIKRSQSILDDAMQFCESDLKQISDHSAMTIAIADHSALIRWSAAHSSMRRSAEQANFIQGGHWAEHHVGTNALALSLRTGQSSCVFSKEHYLPSVQDWVCYAAPIYDQRTQQLLGVVNLSTSYRKHNNLGVLAAERCANLIQSSLQMVQQTQLTLKCFGVAQVYYQGKIIPMTPRQIEILAILSLCKEGLNLEQLHQALYGERKISMGTLKAEISQLRENLQGLIGSRPYQLLLGVQADFLQLERALDADQVMSALQLYTGIFLSKTESPFLLSWRDCIESRLSKAIFKVDDPDLLLRHIARFPDALDAVERLIDLMPLDHPVRELFERYR